MGLLLIQLLRRAGYRLKKVAKLTGVSQSSIERVEAKPAVATLVGSDPGESRCIGGPSKVEAYRPFMGAEFTKQPDVRAVELLRPTRLAGYRGGKSALYELIRAVRPHEVQPLVRFEGLPSRLKYSR